MKNTRQFMPHPWSNHDVHVIRHHAPCHHVVSLPVKVGQRVSNEGRDAVVSQDTGSVADDATGTVSTTETGLGTFANSLMVLMTHAQANDSTSGQYPVYINGYSASGYMASASGGSPTVAVATRITQMGWGRAAQNSDRSC